jgi:glycosyltransferase involved in cell wall biosynthesis
LSVSTLQPRKNYELLIRAFREVADECPHNLVIAGGKGWLYERIIQEISKQGLDDRVLLIGFVDDEDLPALYSGAALFAYPSMYEGFGLPILEALACGVPVINADASSLPEVAGPATKLLPPADQNAWTASILSLLADPGERSRMVAAGILQARKFTWNRAAQQLSEIYVRLLSGESA